MSEQYIYVALIRAHTRLGKLARRLLGYEYTHTALCHNKDLAEFITFSRRTHYNALDAGFMREYRSCYAFGDETNFKTKVFRIPIEDSALTAVNAFVAECEHDDRYLFNVLSMATMPVFHGFLILKAHNCMSFVGKVLQLSGIPMKKKYWRYSIRDIDELLTEHLWFEGLLEKDETQVEGYMDKATLPKRLKSGWRTLSGLTFRLITKKAEP